MTQEEAKIKWICLRCGQVHNGKTGDCPKCNGQFNMVLDNSECPCFCDGNPMLECPVNCTRGL